MTIQFFNLCKLYFIKIPLFNIKLLKKKLLRVLQFSSPNHFILHFVVRETIKY